MTKLSWQRYEEIKSCVADLIEDYGISYPLDPQQLIDKIGIKVKYYNSADIYETGFDASFDGGGYTLKMRTLTGCEWRIGISKIGPAGRKLFTLCHELGHIILHGDGVTTGVDVQEREADFFASYLLMPDVVARLLFASVSEDDLVNYCGVTYSCAREMCRRINREYKGKLTLKEYDCRILSTLCIQSNNCSDEQNDIRLIS